MGLKLALRRGCFVANSLGNLFLAVEFGAPAANFLCREALDIAVVKFP